MNDEWISAADAYELVRKENPSRAAEIICSRAHDGIIVARATTLIVGKKRAEDVDVPAKFWWATGHAALTQAWASGDFETWIDNRIHCRAYGVMFPRRGIMAMLTPAVVTPAALSGLGEDIYASSARCMDVLQKRLKGTEREVANHIIRLCAAGLVEARCASFSYEYPDLFGPEHGESADVTVPDWFWEHCAIAEDAILDWQSGTFAGRAFIEGGMRKARIRGVEFDIAAILSLESTFRRQVFSDPPTRAPNAKSDSQPLARGGRPKKSGNWIDWTAELALFIHEEGVPDGFGAEGQDVVIAAIEERLAARGVAGLSRSTVQSTVRAVLIRLRSAEN